MPYMATTAERLGIVETKVENLEGKIDELKGDVKEMHDCLDRTRDGLNERLDAMLAEYRNNRDKFYEHADKLHAEENAQHKIMTAKIEELEQFKQKWVYMIAGAAVVLSWVSSHLDAIAAFLK